MKKSTLLLLVLAMISTIGFSQPTLSFSYIMQPNCAGQYGQAYVNVSGGSGYYNINWSSGETGNYGSYLPQGINWVVVHDAQTMLSDSLSFFINEIPAIVTNATVVSPSCPGANDGSIHLAVSGGTPGYSYQWSNGNVNQNLFNLPADTFSVTITDSHHCTYNTSAVVAQTLPTIPIISSTNAACGQSNGTVSASVPTGSNFVFSYVWDDPIHSTTDTVYHLAAGAYNVTVTNQHGCVVFGTAIINNTGAPYIMPNVSNITCNGANNGSIGLYVNGGVVPYTYDWSNGDTATYQSSLSAGDYFVTVTDAVSCKAIRQITIHEPTALVLSMDKTDIACFGSVDGGSAQVIVEGGTPSYSYQWNNGNTSSSIYQAGIGTYSVTVTDLNGCSKHDSITVNEPEPLSATFQTIPPSCIGGYNGKIMTTVTGGTPPYTFNWSNQSIEQNPQWLTANTYTLSLQDSRGCSFYTSVTLNDPQGMLVTGVITNVLCNGDTTGAIDISVAGGTPPYMYSWALGTGGPIFSNQSDLFHMPAGSYMATISDSNQCFTYNSFSISQQSQIYTSFSPTNPTCGASNGSIYVSCQNGFYPYTLLWSNGDTASYITGLQAGNYMLTITDSAGCHVTNTFMLNNANAPVLSHEDSDATCFGSSDGTAYVYASSQTATQFSYHWENGATTDNITGLAAGSYDITVTDNLGCSAFTSIPVGEPNEITINFNITNVSCHGDTNGFVEAYANGGNYQYTYVWNNGITGPILSNIGPGTYYLTVTDGINCYGTGSVTVLEPPAIVINSVTFTNISCNGAQDGTITINATAGSLPLKYSLFNSNYEFQTNNVFTGLFANSFPVFVRIDSLFMCTVQYFDTIHIIEPLMLTGDFSQTNITCFGADNGTVTLNAEGGTPPYLYSDDHAISFHASPAFTNLTEGAYILKIKDANGCIFYPGDANISEPDNISFTMNGSQLVCNGDANGNAESSFYGGFPPYTIVWSNAESTQNITNLSAGTYYLSVTDAHSCVYVDSAIVSQPTPISSNITHVNPHCSGDANGFATVNAVGGSPSYTYLWDSGTGYQTTSTANNLPAGVFYVTISDSHNCTTIDSAVLFPPVLLTASTNLSNTTCNNLCNGAVSIAPNGGTSPYTYSISGGQLINLCAGTYYYTVTDSYACTFSGTFNISEPEILDVTATSTISACNACTGTATAIATGGTQPYQYVWNNQVNSATIQELCSQTYSVSATDINGCVDTTTIFVSAQALSTIAGETHWSGGNLPDHSANVELYKIINLTQAELAYSMPITNSLFMFNDVTYGNYFLKINVTDTTTLPHVLSTYLDSTNLWTMADTIQVTCQNSFNLNAPMFEITPPAGQTIGSISGFITYADFVSGGKSITSYEGPKLAGEPVPGAEIYVEIEPDDEPIANTTTNDSGFYVIPSLPSGNSYSMSVDIPGLPMISTYTHIGISSNTTTYTQMNFYVDTASANGGIFVDTSASGIIKFQNDNFILEMYPNPFNEQLSISYKLNNQGKINLDIYDITGKIVTTLVNENQNAGDYKYVFNAVRNNLAEGTYIVKLQVDNTVFIKKILQIK